MKSSRMMVATGLLMGLALAAQPMVASAAEPGIERERAMHPRIVESIRHMQEALHELEAAPDDFGGNKANAIRDLRAAIHSTKRALYFRLRLDDARIDAIVD